MQNVGELDAMIRTASGLTLLGYGTAKRRLMPIVAGSVLTAIGVSRCCPLYCLCGIDTKRRRPMAELKAHLWKPAKRRAEQIEQLYHEYVQNQAEHEACTCDTPHQTPQGDQSSQDA